MGDPPLSDKDEQSNPLPNDKDLFSIENFEDWDTPLDVVKATDELRNNLLPDKSRDKYQSVYKIFTEWKIKNKIKVIKENVLLAYFGELSKKYAPASLWSTYSMLKSIININDNVNLHNYKQLLAFLKKQSSGYNAKKSSVFAASEMNTFLREAPDNKYLVTKVVLIFGIMGACQGAELTSLTVEDIKNRGDVIIVKLRNTKTKIDRNFTIEGEFMKTIMKYQALRPKNTTSDRFFLNYHDGRCTNQVIGKNKIGGMPKEIAIFLHLPNPESYTGHSFRRSSATLVADEGGDITQIKRLGGWKSTTVAEGYIEESVGYKRKTGQQIAAAIATSTTREKVQHPNEKINRYRRRESSTKSIQTTSSLCRKKTRDCNFLIAPTLRSIFQIDFGHAPVPSLFYSSKDLSYLWL